MTIYLGRCKVCSGPWKDAKWLYCEWCGSVDLPSEAVMEADLAEAMELGLCDVCHGPKAGPSGEMFFCDACVKWSILHRTGEGRSRRNVTMQS
jgi:hypothetical protein